jgi:hypothetical protein
VLDAFCRFDASVGTRALALFDAARFNDADRSSEMMSSCSSFDLCAVTSTIGRVDAWMLGCLVVASIGHLVAWMFWCYLVASSMLDWMLFLA